MRHKEIHITDENIDVVSFYGFNFGTTNKKEIEKMKKLLSDVIIQELTEKQRICLLEYYIKGKRMNTIAKELSLNPSTVTRHIKAAQKRLKRVTQYY